MRPVFLRKAHRAFFGYVDILTLKAELLKSARVCAAQIDMRFAVWLILEKSVRLAAEIALHSLGNIVIALKAAFADARADGRMNIFRICSERAHFFDRRAEDILHAALPPAVHRRDDLRLGIVQQNRHTVGNIDHDRQVLHVCHKPVAFDALIRADRVSVGIAGKVNESAVNLLCNDEIVLSAAHDLAGEAVVFADGGVIVAAHATSPLAWVFIFLAAVLGTMNVVGGYVVTDRMLEMFKSDKGKKKEEEAK